MKTTKLAICCVIGCVLASTNWLHADDSPINPTANIANQVLEGVVTGIRGMVQIRQSEDDPWVKAENGMKLTQGAEFRTGPRSSVQFKIPPDQTVVLDRLGTIKLLTAVAEHNKIKTDLGMTYGRTRYDIRKAGFEHESTIRSPSSTLSVRGTRVGIQDGAMGFVAWSTQSSVHVFNKDSRQAMTFGEDTGVDSESTGPADQKKQMGTLDPGDTRSRDGAERTLVAGRPGLNPNPGGAGNIFGPGSRPRIQPTLPINNPNFYGFVPGQLRFELSWSNGYGYTSIFAGEGDPPPTTAQSDLDFWVKSPAPGDVIIGTFSLNKTNLSGGIAGEDVTDGNPYASEVIEWKGPTVPTGVFIVGVDGFSIYDSQGNPTNQPYNITVSAKKLTDEYYTPIHEISGTVNDNQTIEHDVTVEFQTQTPSIDE